MEFVLCMLALLLGVAAGYIAGRSARERQTQATAPAQPADPRLARQYSNFLNYDGTGKGQQNIED